MDIELHSAQKKRVFTMQKALFLCGMLSSQVYIAMNIFIPLFFPGYNAASQTVSELSAIGVPTRTVWILFSVVYTLLVIAFGFGVWQFSGQSRALKVTGFLIFLQGMISIAWPFAPMHTREVLAAGGKTLSDTLHIMLAAATTLIMLAAILYGAAAFGKKFRAYSLFTTITLLLFGALSAINAPKIEANLPTPMAGVWERITIGAFLLWIIVLSALLLKKTGNSFRINNRQRQ